MATEEHLPACPLSLSLSLPLSTYVCVCVCVCQWQLHLSTNADWDAGSSWDNSSSLSVIERKLLFLHILSIIENIHKRAPVRRLGRRQAVELNVQPAVAISPSAFWNIKYLIMPRHGCFHFIFSQIHISPVNYFLLLYSCPFCPADCCLFFAILSHTLMLLFFENVKDLSMQCNFICIYLTFSCHINWNWLLFNQRIEHRLFYRGSKQIFFIFYVDLTQHNRALSK